jgi:ABC-type transport system involved in multi-copper enzyme maturation permease subunit
MRKELSESLRQWQSLYGLLFQSACLVLAAGFVAPHEASIWQSPGQLFFCYAVWPALVSAVYAGDAFVGERERKTLETLYSTPIADISIFGGKLLAALCVALGCAVLALGLGLLTGTVCHLQPLRVVGPAGLAVLLAGALAVGCCVTALATFVSERVHSARAAQQISSLLPMLLIGAVGVVVEQHEIVLDFPSLAMIDGALFVAAVLALWAGVGAVSRGRLRR